MTNVKLVKRCRIQNIGKIFHLTNKAPENFGGFILWEHTGSNRGPSACKADALNQLSYAPIALRDCKDKRHFLISKTILKFIF